MENGVEYSCYYHVVWCTKYRRPVLLGEIDKILASNIETTCEINGIELVSMEIMPDSVHLVVGCSPRLGIHKAVKRLKAESYGVLKEAHPELKSRLPTLWTNKYLVVTVGGMTKETVDRFLERQKGK